MFKPFLCMRDMALLGCNCPATDCCLCKGHGIAHAGQDIQQHSALGSLIAAGNVNVSCCNLTYALNTLPLLAIVCWHTPNFAALVCRP